MRAPRNRTSNRVPGGWFLGGVGPAVERERPTPGEAKAQATLSDTSSGPSGGPAPNSPCIVWPWKRSANGMTRLLARTGSSRPVRPDRAVPPILAAHAQATTAWRGRMQPCRRGLPTRLGDPKPHAPPSKPPSRWPSAAFTPTWSATHAPSTARARRMASCRCSRPWRAQGAFPPTWVTDALLRRSAEGELPPHRVTTSRAKRLHQGPGSIP